MGRFFVMSRRFDKCCAVDFGFIPTNHDMAINPADGSAWKRILLYDFGWGKENGYYRIPLPDFKVLFDLALFSTSRDDVYGSAAVIIDRFSDELLLQCEDIIKNASQKNEFIRLIKLFDLTLPINRSSITNKTIAQIESDHSRWKAVAAVAKAAL